MGPLEIHKWGISCVFGILSSYCCQVNKVWATSRRGMKPKDSYTRSWSLGGDYTAFWREMPTEVVSVCYKHPTTGHGISLTRTLISYLQAFLGVESLWSFIFQPRNMRWREREIEPRATAGWKEERSGCTSKEKQRTYNSFLIPTT